MIPAIGGGRERTRAGREAPRSARLKIRRLPPDAGLFRTYSFPPSRILCPPLPPRFIPPRRFVSVSKEYYFGAGCRVRGVVWSRLRDTTEFGPM